MSTKGHMTKRQKERLVKKIKADCGIAHKYFDDDDWGKTCVIGALIPPRFRQEVMARSNTDTVHQLPLDVRDYLEKSTGLTLEQLRELQNANDDEEGSVPNRRRAVLKKLKELTTK